MYVPEREILGQAYLAWLRKPNETMKKVTKHSV